MRLARRGFPHVHLFGAGGGSAPVLAREEARRRRAWRPGGTAQLFHGDYSRQRERDAHVRSVVLRVAQAPSRFLDEMCLRALNDYVRNHAAKGPTRDG